MSARATFYAALGLAAGFLLGRVLPHTWWVTGAVVVTILLLWAYVRSRRAQ